MIYGKVPAELKGKMAKPGNIDQKMIATEQVTVTPLQCNVC